MRGHESKEAGYCTVERVKGRGGRRMRGQESKEARGKRQQNTPSVEDRAVETLSAFFQGLFYLLFFHE